MLTKAEMSEPFPQGPQCNHVFCRSTQENRFDKVKWISTSLNEKLEKFLETPDPCWVMQMAPDSAGTTVAFGRIVWFTHIKGEGKKMCNPYGTTFM